MSTIEITIDQLRGLIGINVQYQGESYHVVEVLEDGPSLILKAIDEHTVIQPNILGDASRRVPEIMTIPVLSSDKTELATEFLELDLLDI